jgi:hypothetical protein
VFVFDFADLRFVNEMAGFETADFDTPDGDIASFFRGALVVYF